MRNVGNSEVTTHYALRITHYALRITHYALRITHYALRITHYALRITHYALRITHSSHPYRKNTPHPIIPSRIRKTTIAIRNSSGGFPSNRRSDFPHRGHQVAVDST